MSAHGGIVAGAATALILGLAGAGVAAVATPPEVSAQIAAGKATFDVTCANSMCHGPGGAGGRAPPFPGRPLTLEAIRDALENGRPNTPMVAFKDVFDAETKASLTAYVLSVSSKGAAPTAVVASGPGGRPPPGATPPSARPARAMPWLAANASAAPVAVGAGQGVAARGATIFFDATKLHSCRACHTYAGAGGPVGPDLAGRGLAPAQVYAALTTPRAASAAFPGIALTLTDGSRVTGVKRDDSPTAVRYYDVASTPPVSRRVAKAQIAAQADLAEGVYDHRTLAYAPQDLRDLSAFVGQSR